VVLCDITGHGVQAALIVSACKTVLNSFKKYRQQSVDQSTFCLDYLETLNEIIFKQGAGKHTCTMIGITFDIKNQLLHLVTCAHPPALYLSRDRLEERPIQLRTHFNPVGFAEQLSASQKTSPWLPGDQITLHTDGIPITDILRLYRNFLSSFEGEWNQIAPQLYKFLWQKIESSKGKKPDDDVSLIMIRMKATR
jgi:serine phosphatase RsbU (regulator of sigma subunit)